MTKYPKEILELPFDQFSRQSRARQLIDALRKGNESFTILDVGGYKGATKLFHPSDKVTVLDVFDVKEKDYIQGDATAMTLADDSYDFVVSFDVFEHIPRDKRQAFAAECTRVAKRGVIIAAPVGTSENTEAEIAVNQLYKKLHKKDHQWLKEHIDYKLPEPGLAQKLLQANKLSTTSFSSNYTPSWGLMQSAIFGASKFEVVGKRIDALYETYNELLPSDGVPETDENYRAIVLGLKSLADQKVIDKKITTIFMDRQAYFNSIVKLSLAASETLILSLDDLYVASQKEIQKLQTDLDQARADKRGLEDQLAIAKTNYQLVVNSRSYRYGRKIAETARKPKKVLRRQK